MAIVWTIIMPTSAMGHTSHRSSSSSRIRGRSSTCPTTAARAWGTIQVITIICTGTMTRVDSTMQRQV
jgi:hypothetical protein